MARSADDFNHERQALDAAHAQNEAGRDAFVALAHTALFASSVAFVGDVAPLTGAVWKPALILGWLASVVGLLALTVSFGAARKAIDARREALNDEDPPSSHLADALNATALWSFPAALLCLFAFVTANVVKADAREPQAASSTPARDVRGEPAAKVPSVRAERISATAPSAEQGWRKAEPVDRGDPSAASAVPAPAASTPAKQEVKAK